MKRKNFHSLKMATVVRVLLTTMFVAGLGLFYSCEETTTGTNCDVDIKEFELSNSSFSAGATITGSYTVEESIGLDDLTLRNIVNLYISNDGSFSSDDEQLSAFTTAPSSIGDETTVVFDQIEIPFSLAAGQYFILFHISSQPCGNGESIPSTTEVVQVTVG